MKQGIRPMPLTWAKYSWIWKKLSCMNFQPLFFHSFALNCKKKKKLFPNELPTFLYIVLGCVCLWLMETISQMQIWFVCSRQERCHARLLFPLSLILPSFSSAVLNFKVQYFLKPSYDWLIDSLPQYFGN